MNHYIERNKLLELIQESDQLESEAVKHSVMLILQRTPSADVEPVRHGHWEYSHTTMDHMAIVKCSNCGHEAFAIAFYVKDGHYCPNCGANMDEEG